MKQIYYNGFESGGTSGLAGYASGNGGQGAVVGTANVEAGTYALQALISGTSQYSNANFYNSSTEINFFDFKMYGYFVALPNWTTGKTFINFLDNGFSKRVYANLETTGKLTLFDEDGSIGLSTTAMQTGQWYLIEVIMDRRGSAGSHIVELHINGNTEVTSSTRSLSIGVKRWYVGWVESSSNSTQGEVWMDEVFLYDVNRAISNRTLAGARTIADSRTIASRNVVS